MFGANCVGRPFASSLAKAAYGLQPYFRTELFRKYEGKLKIWLRVSKPLCKGQLSFPGRGETDGSDGQRQGAGERAVYGLGNARSVFLTPMSSSRAAHVVTPAGASAIRRLGPGGRPCGGFCAHDCTRNAHLGTRAIARPRRVCWQNRLWYNAGWARERHSFCKGLVCCPARHKTKSTGNQRK